MIDATPNLPTAPVGATQDTTRPASLTQIERSATIIALLRASARTCHDRMAFDGWPADQARDAWQEHVTDLAKHVAGEVWPDTAGRGR